MIDVLKQTEKVQSLKKLDVPFWGDKNESSLMADISIALDGLPKNQIGFTPWQEFSYKPDCKFTLAHGDTCIFLKFFVKEKDLLVRFTQPNDLVYNDSCVEFFIAFEGDNKYYNLEFNAIGTCYLGYGAGPDGIEPAKPETVREIKSSFILSNTDGLVHWELTLMIPVSAFFRHDYQILASKEARANFYKCGDEMPELHYLCWNNIESEKPNFHLPEFFGEVTFGG